MIDILSMMSPQLIESIDNIKLNKPRDNHKYYISLSLKDINFIEEIYPNANLYSKGRKYFVLDATRERIVYFMQWEQREIKGRIAAYQVLVWSDATISEIKGFALKMFFDILFKDNDLIVSDRMQTHLGKRFWEQVISKALQENYFVYALDLNKNISTPINSIDELRSDEIQEYWNLDKLGQAKLMAVSKHPL